MFFVTAAVIAGTDGRADTEGFGREKEDWLDQFVDFPEGIPSHDKISRVLGLIDPNDFQAAFLEWVGKLQACPDEDGPIHIQVDGKTMRGSYHLKDRSGAIHVVSDWASQLGIALGQKTVDTKTNEIKAIPQLLDLIDLENAIVTLDAIGCQKSIARKIIDEGGDYAFALKDNHPKLCAAVESFFETAFEEGLAKHNVKSKVVEEGTKARKEIRSYYIARIPKHLRELSGQWESARTIGLAISHFGTPHGETTEVRYFLSSRNARVNEFAKSGRSHWSTESMHWVLGVVFHEDASHARSGCAAENLSFLRKFVTTLLKRDTTKASLRRKRKRADWSNESLEKLLFIA